MLRGMYHFLTEKEGELALKVDDPSREERERERERGESMRRERERERESVCAARAIET